MPGIASFPITSINCLLIGSSRVPPPAPPKTSFPGWTAGVSVPSYSSGTAPALHATLILTFKISSRIGVPGIRTEGLVNPPAPTIGVDPFFGHAAVPTVTLQADTLNAVTRSSPGPPVDGFQISSVSFTLHLMTAEGDLNVRLPFVGTTTVPTTSFFPLYQ